jgi:hypothetical protein
MSRLRPVAALAAGVLLVASAAVPALAVPETGVPKDNNIWNGYVSHYSKTSKAYWSEADWTVPNAKCADVRKTTSVGIWVGIGGVNSPVVQVGVQILCFHAVRVIAPIWEITPPQKHVNLIPHTVGAGDHIFAIVQVDSPGKYSFEIIDKQRKWTWSKNNVAGPRSTPHEAEWIVEAGGKPLANFGKVTFTACDYGDGKQSSRGWLKTAVKFEAGTKSGLATKVSSTTHHYRDFSVTFLRP